MLHAASSCGSSSDPSWVARGVQLMPREAVRMSDWHLQRQLKLADDFEAWANWKIEAQDRGWIWPDNDFGPDRYCPKTGKLERGWKYLSKEHDLDLRKTIARVRQELCAAKQSAEQEKTATTDIDEPAQKKQKRKKKKRNKDRRQDEFGEPSVCRALTGTENENTG